MERPPEEDKMQKGQESLRQIIGNLGPWVPPQKGPVELPCGKYEIQRPTVSSPNPDNPRK